jgi:hypothetical protein
VTREIEEGMSLMIFTGAIADRDEDDVAVQFPRSGELEDAATVGGGEQPTLATY